MRNSNSFGKTMRKWSEKVLILCEIGIVLPKQCQIGKFFRFSLGLSVFKKRLDKISNRFFVRLLIVSHLLRAIYFRVLFWSKARC